MIENHYELARSLRKADLDTFIVCTFGDFAVHYDLIGDDAPNSIDIEFVNDIPDYVDEVCIAADSARHVLVDIMGFLSEPEDSDGIFDIILSNRDGLNYGVNYRVYDCEPGCVGELIDGSNCPLEKDEEECESLGCEYSSISNEDIECSEYRDMKDIDCRDLGCHFTTNGQSLIEIDNSFDEPGDWYTTGFNTMRLVVAHEYFHAIQRAYRQAPSNDNQFFYELTSTWIEDVIVPDGNDYLYWIDPFLNDPDQNFNNLNPNDGYSLALYGHYLSTQIQNVNSQSESSIMELVWQQIKNGKSPADGIDNVLEIYNRTFIDTWIDFCTRNLFNDKFIDMNNDIFYYIDQTSSLVSSLNVEADVLVARTYSLSLDDNSALIQSIRADMASIIQFTYTDFPEVGQVAIVRENAADHYILYPENGLSISLNQNDKIHFVFGSNSNYQSIDVDVQPSYFPIAPVMEYVDVSHDEHVISWNASPGPGVIREYQVFRNSIEIDTTSDTTYTDSNFERETDYWYKVTCDSEIGISNFSDSLFVTSWPSRMDIVESRILNAYPNPVYSGSNFTILIDVGADMIAPRDELYNIHGQVAVSSSGGDLIQGRHELQLSNILSPQLSNGVYFLTIHLQNVDLHQRITLIK